MTLVCLDGVKCHVASGFFCTQKNHHCTERGMYKRYSFGLHVIDSPEKQPFYLLRATFI